MSGKHFEVAALNYNGDVALIWQTLWVGPLLADSQVGSPKDVSDQLLPMLETQSRRPWKWLYNAPAGRDSSATMLDDRFWSIFAMPIGVAMCFGPAMLIWWLVDRKKSSQDEQESGKH